MTSQKSFVRKHFIYSEVTAARSRRGDKPKMTQLGWSCWYSPLVKDGVSEERVFQAFCAEVCFLVFVLWFDILSTLAADDL
jgi:hypothetical protein